MPQHVTPIRDLRRVSLDFSPAQLVVILAAFETSRDALRSQDRDVGMVAQNINRRIENALNSIAPELMAVWSDSTKTAADVIKLAGLS